jgi:hypothetical protein
VLPAVSLDYALLNTLEEFCKRFTDACRKQIRRVAVPARFQSFPNIFGTVTGELKLRLAA